MACLQIYRELLSLATFLRVYSNSKEVSYLSWQNIYPHLKTTGHIKLKFFWWIKLLKNLLLAKYLISAAVPLTYYLINFHIQYINFFLYNFVNLPNFLMLVRQVSLSPPSNLDLMVFGWITNSVLRKGCGSCWSLFFCISSGKFGSWNLSWEPKP